MGTVAAGIVLYNPELNRLRANITAIIAQVSYLCLVDNGSKNLEEIYNLANDFDGIDVVALGENKGIAYALNRIVDNADKQKCEWVITLDQDSVSPDNLVSEYQKYLDYAPDIAMFTPKIFDNNEESGTNIVFKNDCEYIERCITSASMLKIAASRDVGGFDEKMFIDYVDFDLCQNLLNHGYKILRVNTIELKHEVGKAKEIKILRKIGNLFKIKKLQKPFYTYCHSPLRTYYYARNTFYYIAKYRDTINVKTEKKIFIKWMIFKIFFEDQKFKKIKAMIRGIKDSKILINELK